jgi:hypothetical protein
MKTRTKGRTISIRLYPEDEELLREQASAGTKALGAVAEKLIVQSLHHSPDEELGYIRQKIVQLEGELQTIQEQLMTSVEAILLAIVNRRNLTTEQVKEWVRIELKKE